MKEHRSKTPQKEKSAEELVQQLEEFPYLRERLEAILGIVKQEGGRCETAAAAEMALVEELRKLGKESLTEWARHGQVKAVSEVLSKDPEIKRHSKKN